MIDRFIKINKNKCTECGECKNITCPDFKESSGNYGTTILRPNNLRCYRCRGECTLTCENDAIELIDATNPLIMVCRSKTVNNFA